MANWIRRISALFFPSKCIFCRELLPADTPLELAVCKRCERELPYTMAQHRCKGCGRPVEDGYVYCRLCRDHKRRPFVKICTAYVYRGVVKASIVRFKQEQHRGYAKVYARHLAAVITYDCPKVKFDAVVATPPRKKGLQDNGYDQAEALAMAVAQQMELPYLPRVLMQKRRKKKQSTLSRIQRWNNQMGNVAVIKPDVIRGKTVLLVDDVCTTGATMFASAKALQEAGVGKVYCAAAATAKK